MFTVCDKAATEESPLWPNPPMTAHRGVPDPVQVDGPKAVKRVAFSDTYRMLRNPISIFVNLLLASLDRLAIQKNLDDIGKITDLSEDAAN